MLNHHAYTAMFFHLIWSTKDRYPFITPECKKSLYNYIGKTAAMKNWQLLAIGGIEDHMHVLIQKRPRHDISYVVCHLKASSSKFMRKNFNNEFEWQGGYSAFTVDMQTVPRIKNYILKQEEHHKNKDFEMEQVLFTRRYRISTKRPSFNKA